MSLSDKQVITCPECKSDQEMEVWHSINTSANPEMRMELFHGKVNLFTCEKCDHKAFINTSLLYHDLDREFSIQYYPPENMTDRQFFNNFLSEFPTRLALSLPEDLKHLQPKHLTQPHIVFDLADMVYSIQFYERLLDLSKESRDNDESK